MIISLHLLNFKNLWYKKKTKFQESINRDFLKTWLIKSMHSIWHWDKNLDTKFVIITNKFYHNKKKKKKV